jgi:hypothetical protein
VSTNATELNAGTTRETFKNPETAALKKRLVLSLCHALSHDSRPLTLQQ